MRSVTALTLMDGGGIYFFDKLLGGNQTESTEWLRVWLHIQLWQRTKPSDNCQTHRKTINRRAILWTDDTLGWWTGHWLDPLLWRASEKSLKKDWLCDPCNGCNCPRLSSSPLSHQLEDSRPTSINPVINDSIDPPHQGRRSWLKALEIEVGVTASGQWDGLFP